MKCRKELEMSTRCIVRIAKNGREVTLYHHHDGYPEGVGKDLMERFGKILQKEKIEIEKGFQSWLGVCDIANQLIKDSMDSYELTIGNHTDREYEYFISLDEMKIYCFRVDVDWVTGLTLVRDEVDLYELF